MPKPKRQRRVPSSASCSRPEYSDFTIVTAAECQVCSPAGDREGSTGQRVCEPCLGSIRLYSEEVEQFMCSLCLHNVCVSVSCINGHKICEHCFARGVRANSSNFNRLKCQVFIHCKKDIVLVPQ